MSTLPRTLRNLWRVGPRSYLKQMMYIGDTKSGTLIGKDKYGNSFFENLEEELPLRTRWVEYKDHEFDPSQIEPGWHAWISYMTDAAPPKDPLTQSMHRPWEPTRHVPNMTNSRSAFKTYSTTRPKTLAWTPKAEARS